MALDKDKVGGLALGLEQMTRQARLAADVLDCAGHQYPSAQEAAEIVAGEQLRSLVRRWREWGAWIDREFPEVKP